ncbi:MAG: type II secretion system F family protein [Pseudomonadota bacterium]
MQFEIRGLKGAQGLVNLSVQAADEASALAMAQAQGLAVLSVRSKRAWALPSLRKSFPLLLFAQELLALLSAGLSLVEVIETMIEKEQRPEARKLLMDVRAALFEGRSFSQALEAHPSSFPTLFVATVRAAERTGDLPEALARYIDYHQRIDQVRKKIVSASIYPAVLIAVGGLVTLFLLGYVVPRFAGIYADSGQSLPFLSRLLIDWGNLLNAHGGAVLAIATALVAGTIYLFMRAPALLARLAQRIPSVGARMRVYQLARFYRTLGMLLRGGTPLVPALTMVAGLLPAAMRASLGAATQRIREGTSISAAMDAEGLATPVALRMLRVGEKSGDMAQMMERIAVFHDEELARWIDWFTKLFEPLLMALIGVVIGAIVVLMYLPIFELAGSLQ